MLLPDHEIRRLCDPNREEWQTTMTVEDGVLRPLLLPGPHSAMIAPFSEGISGGGVISYGLSHAGYDLRLGPEIMLFKNSGMEIIDPKRFMDRVYQQRMFDEWIMTGGRGDAPDPGFLHDYFPIEEPGEVVKLSWSLNGTDVTQASHDNSYTIPPNSYILGRSLEYLRIPRHLKGRCVGKSTLARCGILVNTTPLEPGWEGHLTIEIGNITPCPAKVYVGEGVAQLEFETLSSLPEKDYGDKKGKYQGQTGVTPARVL